MIFRQLMDPDSNTYTYLIGDPWSREAVLIDPVVEQVERDLGFLSDLGLKLVYALDTHVHADHITGAGQLRARTGCQVVLSRASAVTCADLLVDDGDAIRFGLQAIEVRATPGHTNSCVSYVTADRARIFTGDALLIRGCGRTDFQEGDAHTLFHSIHDKVFSLPDDTLVFPAHDYRGRTVSTVREEKLYNPRLGGGRTEAQFVEIMGALDLAYPRKIDVSLPANRLCGVSDATNLPERPPESWAVQRTPTGAPNLPPLWVAENKSSVRLIDVRTPEEWSGPLGHLDGAELVPLGSVLGSATSWDRNSAVVLYCRSGGRSDAAAIELEKLGFRKVASMSGGMLQWNALGLPVAADAQG